MKINTLKLISVLIIFTSSTVNSQCVQGNCTNGEGTVIYSSGNKYQGNFKDGKKHGFGRFIWTSGSKYKGNWKMNKRDGYGEEFLSNGTRYKGQFSNDKKHGEGVLYAVDGSILKEGEWQYGQFVQSSNRLNDNQQNTNKIQVVNNSQHFFDKHLNAGVGLGSTIGGGYTLSNGSYSKIPPLSVSLDLVQLDNGVKIGGYLGYTSDKITYSDNFYGDWGWKSSYYILGVRGTYDFDLFKKSNINTYGGVLLGYNVVKASYFGDDIFSNGFSASASSFTYSGFIGMRYMFSPSMGAFGELGYGVAYLTIGATKKF